MRTILGLIAGVSLAFGAADWSRTNDAAMAAMRQNDYTDAIQLFGECVNLSTTQGERITSFASYGIVLNRAGRNPEAKAALENALRESEAADAIPQHTGRAVIAGTLASVDRSLGDYQGAERVLRNTIGDPHASAEERATLMVSLADILREQVRATEANAVLSEASELTGLSARQRTGILVEEAELTRDMRLWAPSIALWNRIQEIAVSDRSTELEAYVAGGLGETWFEAGNLARAEPLLRRSLQLLRSEGAAPPQVATALALTARLYIREDKLALAEDALDEAITKDEDSLGAGHPQVAMLLEVRADILSRRGEAQPAREDLERARVIMADHFGPGSPAVAGVYASLGDVEDRDKRPAAAVVDYGIAVDLLRKAGSDGATYGAVLAARYAAALKAAQRIDKGRAGDAGMSRGASSFAER